MLIIGAKGFAKEVLEILFQDNNVDDVAFFDNVNKDIENTLFNKFKVLKSDAQVAEFFTSFTTNFTIGIGGPLLRFKLYQKFKSLGGNFKSTISPYAIIGNFDNRVGKGCNIMSGVIITSDIQIGTGVLINIGSTIGHDSIIGDFVEISPGVNISGNCSIGKFSNLGTNSTILPKVKIGENVTVGAGSVVTKDIPSNCIVVGIPAKIIKELPPIDQ